MTEKPNRNLTARFRMNIDSAKAKDTGMAVCLILLIAASFTGNKFWLSAAIAVLVLNMVWHNFFRPFAYVWFGLGAVMGAVVSRVILTIIFFVLVTPISWIRRLRGEDILQLRKWKQGEDSVFTVRNQSFEEAAIKNPY